MPPMVFQWFLILLPSLSMVFDGSGPLVKRCDGFDGSLWSRRECGFLSIQNFKTTLSKKQHEEREGKKQTETKSVCINFKINIVRDTTDP